MQLFRVPDITILLKSMFLSLSCSVLGISWRHSSCGFSRTKFILMLVAQLFSFCLQCRSVYAAYQPLTVRLVSKPVHFCSFLNLHIRNSVRSRCMQMLFSERFERLRSYKIRQKLTRYHICHSNYYAKLVIMYLMPMQQLEMLFSAGTDGVMIVT